MGTGQHRTERAAQAWKHSAGRMPELRSLDARQPQSNPHSYEVPTMVRSEVVSVHDELSGSKDNPHLFIHNTNKPPIALKAIDFHQAKKDLTVGLPYKVKTKLPFYDSKGTF